MIELFKQKKMQTFNPKYQQKNIQFKIFFTTTHHKNYQYHKFHNHLRTFDRDTHSYKLVFFNKTIFFVLAWHDITQKNVFSRVE